MTVPVSYDTPQPSGPQRRRDNLRGAVFMIAAAGAFAATAALVKALGDSGVDAFQTVFVRAVIGLLVVGPMLWARGIVPWRSSHMKLHLSRSITGGLGVTIGFYAFTVIPLATATAMNFTTPLFITLLAAVVLREKVGWRRWSATTVGFLGVIVMIQPGSAAFDPLALIVLIQALCIAISVGLVKSFPRAESQLSMLFFTFCSSGLISAWPALAHWHMPDLDETLLLLGVAFFGITAQACVLRAYRLGEASYIAPLSYIRLIFAGLLGIVFFAEYPDLATWIGAVVIIAAAFYTARRTGGGAGG
jgi:drug/metabolite transporter (DMT)-like permease